MFLSGFWGSQGIEVFGFRAVGVFAFKVILAFWALDSRALGLQGFRLQGVKVSGSGFCVFRSWPDICGASRTGNSTQVRPQIENQ